MLTHQSDWDTNLGSQGLNSNQLLAVKNKLNNMMKKAITDIDEMKHATAQDQHAIYHQIEVLNTRALQSLQYTESDKQSGLLLNKVNFRYQQVIASAKLVDISRLVIGQIHKASLTKGQQLTAVSEIKDAKRYARQDILQARSIISIWQSATSGINAIYGALTKYVADIQINTIDYIKAMVHKSLVHINQQGKLSTLAKAVAVSKLETIQQRAVNALMVHNNFSDLAKVRRDYCEQLALIDDDQDHALVHITGFSNFVQKANAIVMASSLSAEDRLNLKRRIDQFTQQTLKKLEMLSYSKITTQRLIINKQQIALMVINAVSRSYQEMINDQKISLNRKQRQTLVRRVRKMTEITNSKPLTLPIEQSLPDQLHRLAKVVDQRKRLVYVDIVKRFINQLQSQIQLTADLSDRDKSYLQTQVMGFSTRLQHNQLKSDQAKVALQKFFDKQYQYIQKSSVHWKIIDLMNQIKVSHLAGSYKQTLNQRLMDIKKDRKATFSDQRLFIRGVKSAAVDDARKSNQQRLDQVHQTMLKMTDSLMIPTLRQRLDRNWQIFNQRLDDYFQIHDLDHQEQKAENRAYQTFYQLNSTSDSIDARKLFRVMIRIHDQFTAVVAQPSLRQLVSDRIDQALNSQLLTLVKDRQPQAMKLLIRQLKRDVKSHLKSIQSYVQRFYVRSTDRLVQDARYQLMAYSATNYFDRLGQLRLKALMKINGASDLLHIEVAWWNSQAKVVDLTSHVIDDHDVHKATAHRQVQQAVANAKHQLGTHNSLIINNQILMVSNQADDQINRYLNDGLKAICHRCQQQMSQIIHHRYLDVWLRNVDRARVTINNLVHVSTVDKHHAVKLVHKMTLPLARSIRTSADDQLSDVVSKGNARIQKIINKTSYLDPDKQRVRNRLMKLVQQIERDAGKYQSNKIYSLTLTRLSQFKRRIDEQISLKNNHQLQAIYRNIRKQLMNWQMNIIKRARLQEFAGHFQRVSKQVQDFHYLSAKGRRPVEVRLNRCYHKTIYGIKHASNVKSVDQAFQNGKQASQHCVDQAAAMNAHKQRIYQAIEKRVHQSLHQVKSLTYLQAPDRTASEKLLRQVLKLANQRVRNATTRKQIFAVEHKSYSVIKKVINEVSSAAILLAAINSANNRVSQSTLNRQQKRTALKQIHTIINNGIKAQVKKPDASSSHTKPKRQAPAESTAKPKRHHFFRRLFGRSKND